MALIRDCTDSKKIDLLSTEAERFFYRLCMKVDDFGNHIFNLKQINGSVFPRKNFSDKKIGKWIDELFEREIIGYYQVEGEKYIHIIDFGQKKRRMVARFPEAKDVKKFSQCPTNVRQMSAQSPPEVEGEEEVEEEEEASPIFERDLNWFKSQVDEIWIDKLPTEKKLKLGAAIENAWTFLSADSHRLKVSDSSDCKKLVAKAFEFIKTQSNGTNQNRKQQHNQKLAGAFAAEYGDLLTSGKHPEGG